MNSGNKKIMLVDDDPDDRKYFGEALHDIDDTMEFVTARDGQQALEYLEDPNIRLPDFIFMDLRMPRISGLECLGRLKADQRLREIPVIIYTTSREVCESEALVSLGAVHFVTKPSDPEEIYYLLSVVLEEQLGSEGSSAGFP